MARIGTPSLQNNKELQKTTNLHLLHSHHLPLLISLMLDVNRLIHPLLHLLVGLLALKQERELLQRAPARLGEEEEDAARLERDPAAVPDVVLPPDAVHADGVDEGVDEVGGADPPLLHGDTLCADGEGEDFDEIR